MKEYFSLITTPNGNIVEIIHNSYGFLEVGKSLLAIIEKSSMGKLFSFLKEISDFNSAVGWEVNIELETNKYKTYHIAGFKNKDENLTIIGSTENHNTRLYYEELMIINNEQANSIRNLLKANQKLDRSSDKQDEMFNELTKLNNEMANLQRELSKKNYALNNANVKLEELNLQKSKFLGMAAHDLRNPLAFIERYSEILLKEKDAISKQEELQILADIHRSSLLMLSLVDDFLDISKIESGIFEIQPTVADIIETVRNSVESHKFNAAKKNIELKIVKFTESFFTEIDVFKIIQVLNNLISNAIKYSNKNTRVNVHISKTEHNILIEIIDEGQGIPENEISTIFNAYTTSSVKSTAGEKSTGLGLSIVQKIVEAHGGKYGVTSKVGVGSTFWFSIPVGEIIEKSKIKSDIKLTEDKSDIFIGKKILIVDDDILARKIAERLFFKLDCTVFTATNGQEALEIIEKEKIDLVLMDHHMPIMDGITATKELRKKFGLNDLIIFGLTGATDNLSKNDLLEAGMNFILNKPPKLENIINSLTELKENKNV